MAIELCGKGREHTYRDVAIGSVVSSIGNAFGKSARFAFQIILSRSAGSDIFGMFAVWQSLFVVLGSIGRLGLEQGIARFVGVYIGSDMDKVKSVLIKSLCATFVASFVIGIIVYMFSYEVSTDIFSESRLSFVVELLVVAVPANSILVVTGYYLIALRKPVYDELLNNFTLPLMNLLCLACYLYLDLEFNELVTLLVLSVFLNMLAILFATNKIGLLRAKTMKKVDTDLLLRFSLPTLISSFSYTCFGYFDRLFLGAFLSFDEVGIYQVAALVSANIPIFLGAINRNFIGAASNLYSQGDVQGVEQLFHKVTNWGVLLTAPIFICLFTMAGVVASVFKIVESDLFYVPFYILVCSHVVNVLTGPVARVLQMTGHQKIEMYSSFVLLIFNAIMNFIMIPIFGLVGAALATTLSITMVNVIRSFAVWRIFKFHPLSFRSGKVFFAAALVSLSIVFIKDTFLLSGTVVDLVMASAGCLLYLIYIYFFALNKLCFLQS